jgi:serine/threonine protein phosphatase PrpC
MSDHGGPGGQARREAHRPVDGIEGVEVASSTLEEGRPDREAMTPQLPTLPKKAIDVSTQSSWQHRWQGFWRRLVGLAEPTSPAAPPPALEEPPAVRPMRLRVGVVSTVGNYREHNEDNFYLPTLAGKAMGGGTGSRDACLEVPGDDGSQNLFIVADGMGGQLAGEKASQMAVDIIPREVSRRIGVGDNDDQKIQRAIREAVAAANQEILGLSVVQTEFNNMGTTVVLTLFRGDRVFIAGIGDSRAYRIRDGQIEQLTKDHSLAQALLEAGTITAEELPNHKFNHVLYLYLGSKDARTGPEDVRSAEVRPGDRFLLASDGLTGVVPDAQLAEIVSRSDDPQLTARSLMQLALDNHSKDNVTCLVIHVL